MLEPIWRVLTYELVRNLKRRGYIFTTLGLPLVGIVVLFGVQLLGGGNPQDQLEELQVELERIERAGFVDYSGLYGDVSDQFTGVLIPFTDEDAAQAAMNNDEVDVYFVFPEDYVETGATRMVLPEMAIAQLMEGDEVVKALIYSQYLESIDQSILLRLLNSSVIERVEFTQAQTEFDEAGTIRNEDNDFWIVYGFAMLFMVALFTTNGYLMQTVIEEKETRLIEILISSVRPVQLMIGKILALGMLGLIQLVLWFVTVYLLSQIAANSSELADTFISQLDVDLALVPVLLVYFILGYLLWAAAFGAVGALSTSLSEGPNLVAIFTIPALAPMFVISAFIESPNGGIATGMSLFPLTSPLAMVMRSVMTDVPFIEILASIALLTLGVGAMMWIAGRLFRVQMLLSGQSPKIRDIPKLIFSA